MKKKRAYRKWAFGIGLGCLGLAATAHAFHDVEITTWSDSCREDPTGANVATCQIDGELDHQNATFLARFGVDTDHDRVWADIDVDGDNGHQPLYCDNGQSCGDGEDPVGCAADGADDACSGANGSVECWVGPGGACASTSGQSVGNCTDGNGCTCSATCP